jgi:hypothetical protein
MNNNQPNHRRWRRQPRTVAVVKRLYWWR